MDLEPFLDAVLGSMGIGLSEDEDDKVTEPAEDFSKDFSEDEQEGELEMSDADQVEDSKEVELIDVASSESKSEEEAEVHQRHWDEFEMQQSREFQECRGFLKSLVEKAFPAPSTLQDMPAIVSEQIVEVETSMQATGVFDHAEAKDKKKQRAREKKAAAHVKRSQAKTKSAAKKEKKLQTSSASVMKKPVNSPTPKKTKVAAGRMGKKKKVGKTNEAQESQEPQCAESAAQSTNATQSTGEKQEVRDPKLLRLRKWEERGKSLQALLYKGKTVIGFTASGFDNPDSMSACLSDMFLKGASMETLLSAREELKRVSKRNDKQVV